ncbi:MAG: response regulator transcription factor [Pseudonocardiaceae bacterium]
MNLRVAVQERKRFLRDGLAILLSDEPDIEVVGTATTAAELLRLCHEHSPDVVLIELEVDDWDPGALVAALRADHPAIRVVGVGAGHDGVNAQLTRTDGLTAIVAALRSSARCELSANGSAATVPAVGVEVDHRLTARQIEIVQHLCAGLTANEIAASLGISPKTVEHHKRRIFAQLGVHSQAQAVAVFLRNGTDAPSPAGHARRSA